jgi:hypothetical protein
MKTYTVTDLKNKFEEKGYFWPHFHLIGIRSKNDLPNEFDDKFYLINGNSVHEYTGTTNPGKAYLLNPLTKDGTAVLKPGQYIDSWTLGLHRGVYKAWTQVKVVTVYRDNDKDIKSENLGVEQKGLFGINVHRASENAISKWVDKWSAGCMVLNNPVQYKEFILLSSQSSLKYFTLTLLEEF